MIIYHNMSVLLARLLARKTGRAAFVIGLVLLLSVPTSNSFAASRQCYSSVSYGKFFLRSVPQNWIKFSVHDMVLWSERMPQLMRHLRFSKQKVGPYYGTGSFGLTDGFRRLKSQCRSIHNNRMRKAKYLKRRYRDRFIKWHRSSLSECTNYFSRTHQRYGGLMCN